jgi:hypothetical protein
MKTPPEGASGGPSRRVSGTGFVPSIDTLVVLVRKFGRLPYLVANSAHARVGHHVIEYLPDTTGD